MSRLLLILILFSCSRNETQKIQESYEGPIIEIKDLNTFFSDSAKVRFKLKSDLYQVFTSGEAALNYLNKRIPYKRILQVED